MNSLLAGKTDSIVAMTWNRLRKVCLFYSFFMSGTDTNKTGTLLKIMKGNCFLVMHVKFRSISILLIKLF